MAVWNVYANLNLFPHGGWGGGTIEHVIMGSLSDFIILQTYCQILLFYFAVNESTVRRDTSVIDVR